MKHTAAAAKWAKLTPEELEVIESGGRACYRDKLKRKDPKTGETQEVPVMVRAPNTLDKAHSRLEALAWAQKLAKDHGQAEPRDVKAAEALYGAYFDELDTMCLLSRCVLEVEPPHDPYMLPEMLVAHHPRATLLDIWERLAIRVSQEDIRASELTESEVLAMVAEIDRRRDLGPLAAIALHARDSFVLTTASLLQSYLTGKRSSPSTAT